jgi:RNA polymerase sigma-70 factor (family 1)
MRELSTYNNDELIRLLKEDNQQAFSEIYDRYWEKLFDYAEKILQGRAASQDAVQEVFIDLWKRRLTIQIESLQSFLYQAVRFQVFKTIRSEKMDADFFKRLSAVSYKLIAEDPIIFRDLEKLFEKVLAGLPEDQRIIFKLNRDQGLTYKEIAEQRNISVKTVEKKMSLALQHIRINLENALTTALAAYFIS